MNDFFTAGKIFLMRSGRCADVLLMCDMQEGIQKNNKINQTTPKV